MPEDADNQLPKSGPPGSVLSFWMALLAPLVFALVLVANRPQIKSDVFGLVLVAQAGGALLSSAYCAVWLAKRFAKARAGRVALGVVCFVGLMIFHCILAVLGCVIIIGGID